MWAIVIGLGALIVVGVAVMVTMLVMGAGSKRGGAAGGDVSDIRMLDIPVAAGTQISQLNSDGSRITMVVRGPEGDEVILLDASKGTVLMRARLVPR